MPSSQSCELFQSGHQRDAVPPIDASAARVRGAANMKSSVATRPGTHQTSRSPRQLPPTAGSTTGIDSADASMTPTSMPLVEIVLASQARAGAQSRIRVGSAG